MMDTISFRIYKISIFLLSLLSIYAWFLWDLNIPVLLFTFVSTISFMLFQKNRLSNDIRLLNVFFVLLLFEIYNTRDDASTLYMSSFVRTFVLGSIIFLKDNDKKEVLQFITKYFSIILAISIIAWILFLIGVPLPHTFTTFQDGKYYYANYYFFLYNLDIKVFFLPRFSSIFLEPGHLSMVTTVLILANKFNLKKWTVRIFIAATLLSFSLAGYVLLLLAYIMHVILESKKPILNLLISLIFISAITIFFKTFQEGQNPVNLFILERLKYEDGDISGNNRTGFIFDEYFKDFLHSTKVITGIGVKSFNNMYGLFGKGVAGIKVYIVIHGILGAILILLLYGLYFLYYPSQYALIIIINYFLSFYQRAYPLAEILLIPFFLALPLFSSKKIGNL